MGPNTYECYAEAFAIFARYVLADDVPTIAAGQEQIWAGPDPDQTSDADHKRLIELGWRPDYEFDCWAIYT